MFEAELTNKSANVNLLMSLVITVFAVPALFRLHRQYKKGDDCRFVYHSMFAWSLGWGILLLLWLLESLLPTTPTTLLLLLSDSNTVLDVLIYLGLTKGCDFHPRQFVLAGLLLVLSAGGIDLLLLHFPGGVVGTALVGPILQEEWSRALSMLSPLLVGWAFRQRYGTYWVLIAGVVYSFLQPAAYEVVLHKHFSDENGAAVLSILAILKVVYAFSVLRFAGIRPQSCKSLTQLPGTAVRDKVQNGSWPRLTTGFVIAGAIAWALAVVFYVKLGIVIIVIRGLYVVLVPVWIEGVLLVVETTKLMETWFSRIPLRTTFRLGSSHDANIVALAGSFNDWNQNETLCSRRGGEWVCRVKLKPGKYAYKFVVDGTWVTDPKNPITEHDESGHINSVVFVRAKPKG